MKRTITEKDIKHVAGLARLNITGEEIQDYVHHLDKVLEYVEFLDQVDTSSVEPFFSMKQEFPEKFHNPFREDKVKESLGAKDILRNSPDSAKEQFKLKAVIEDS